MNGPVHVAERIGSTIKRRLIDGTSFSSNERNKRVTQSQSRTRLGSQATPSLRSQSAVKQQRRRRRRRPYTTVCLFRARRTIRTRLTVTFSTRGSSVPYVTVSPTLLNGPGPSNVKSTFQTRDYRRSTFRVIPVNFHSNGNSSL